MRGQPTDSWVAKRYAAAWRSLVPVTEAVAQTLVMRDFHVDNLMWLPERDRVARCGVLDFQDAVVGPAPYDLMSLLEDARRDVAPSLVADMKRRYFDALPHFAGSDYDAAYAVLAAQRHCKVIGIFTRLAQRDGKYDYLIHIPRVWRLLEAACRHPVLAPVSAWLDEQIPAGLRGIPRITGNA
jgi:aminoglycoside/choline kinase family phosphotransferase